jgi:crotonobetainyl-CoA:carnitine CoA-transferase CaiB-like acyl-CoA transferase
MSVSEPAGPLAGIRVVDLTTMISGPIATRMLGDQGADVVKVEAPGSGDLVRQMGIRRGGDLSATFVASNRNKRSIVVDLKSERGREVLAGLIRSADVFVQNFRPGTAERMGLGAEALRRERPDLVYVSISGFGEQGPYAHKRVYDPLIQALSGLADVQRDRTTNRPRMVRTIVPDKLTAVTAAQAITAALLARARTGEGQHVRLAMLDAMVSFLWPEGLAELTFRDHRSRHGERGSLAQELIYETSDGFITAGAVSDAEWQGLCRALEQPGWLEDERFSTPGGRVANAEQRLTLTAEVMATRTTGEWLERLDAEQVPCAPVLRRWDVPAHPQVAANELVREVEHPRAGPMRDARPAARFDAYASEPGRPAPGLGEHTDELLLELGYAAPDIARLRELGAVA